MIEIDLFMKTGSKNCPKYLNQAEKKELFNLLKDIKNAN